MTKLSDSAHTERLGVADGLQVCAKARMVFRTITTDDVGIDGFLEVMEDGIATGIIAGVQIKSGDSFVDADGLRFRFVSDQEHFGYWARCSFPVVGVVFSPKHNRSVWLDLTSLSSDRRIAEGPYSVSIDFTQETAFTPTSLISKVVPRITQYTYQRRTLRQIQELLQPVRVKSELQVPELAVASEKEEAWHELIETLFSPTSTDEAIGDAAYRLSWHLPSISASLREYLERRFAHMGDAVLVRILEAVHTLLEAGADPTADLVAELLGHLPDSPKRIERLLKRRRIPSACREAAIQVIEYQTQAMRPDLRNQEESGR